MKGYKEICEIATERDDAAGYKTLPVLLNEASLDVGGVLEASKQRSLRAVLVSEGRPVPRERVAVHVDKEKLVLASMAWIDGFVIGLGLAKPEGLIGEITAAFETNRKAERGVGDVWVEDENGYRQIDRVEAREGGVYLVLKS